MSVLLHNQFDWLTLKWCTNEELIRESTISRAFSKYCLTPCQLITQNNFLQHESLLKLLQGAADSFALARLQKQVGGGKKKPSVSSQDWYYNFHICGRHLFKFFFSNTVFGKTTAFFKHFPNPKLSISINHMNSYEVLPCIKNISFQPRQFFYGMTSNSQGLLSTGHLVKGFINMLYFSNQYLHIPESPVFIEY